MFGTLGAAFGEMGAGRADTLDPAAAALMARMTTPPVPARAVAINALVVALKAAGAWGRLDVLYVMAAADAQAAGLNWKDSAYPLTPVNAPTFTADRGYTGNGSSSYLTTGFDPSAAPAGMVLAQNDACIGVYTLTDSASNGYEAGNVGNRMKARNRTGSLGSSVSLSTTTTVSVNGVTPPVHVTGIRRDAANQLLFRQGVEVGSGANASAGLPGAFEILRANTAYSDRQVAIAYCGAALSDAAALAAHAAFTAYLAAVGAV